MHIVFNNNIFYNKYIGYSKSGNKNNKELIEIEYYNNWIEVEK
jgi:hypothetical protein